MKRILNAVIIVGIVLSLLPLGSISALASAPVPPTVSPQSLTIGESPMPPTRSINFIPKSVPVVQLNPTQGYNGQQIVVSGTVDAGASGVRITWKYGGTMLTAAIVTPDAGGAYQSNLVVPHDATPGGAQVCVAMTGAENASFGCADFQITLAPLGAVTGQLPPGVIQTANDARFLLLDRAGGLVTETAVALNGSFSLPNITPGIYQTALVGGLDPAVQTQAIVVKPSQTSTVALGISSDANCDSRIQVSQVYLSPSANASSAYEKNVAGIAEFPPPLKSTANYDFGVYLIGVALQGTLQVSTNGSVSAERPPKYTLVSPDKNTQIQGTLTGSNHQFQVSVALGDARINAPGIWDLHIQPQDSKGTSYCDVVDHVRFIGDPMKNNLIFQPASSSTTWDGNIKRYTFKGWIPNLGGLLPLKYPQQSWKLPLIGDASNEFNAGVNIEGNMTLDCIMTFTLFKVGAEAQILGLPVMDKTYEPTLKPQQFNPDNLNALAFSIETTLMEKDWHTQVYNGVLATYFGVVSVNAAIYVGLHGSILLNMTLYPLQPALDLEIDPVVAPYLQAKLWVDLLLGVASAGATAMSSVSVALPFHINPTAAQKTWFDTPCVGFRVDLSVWARINLGFVKKSWSSEAHNLVDANSCGKINPSPDNPPTPPKILGTPSIAASPDGGMLVVFVGDAAPSNATPTPKVYALYKAPGASGWPDSSHAKALTDGTLMVQDPVAAFYGPQNKAIVLWTQTNISAADENNADLNGILDRQDIFYASGSPQTNTWSSPNYITNDSKGSYRSDGRSAVAGDNLGITVAWVRARTSPYNRSLTDIVVENLDSNLKLVSSKILTTADNGMMAQPSVARAYNLYSNWDMKPFTGRYVAYTANADLSAPDPNNRKRHIQVWAQYGDNMANDWTDMTGNTLPPNAFSPAINIDPHGAPMLAYLLSNGTSSQSGGPSDPTAYLYFAWAEGSSSPYWWNSIQVQRNNAPIQAEKPVWAWKIAGNYNPSAAEGYLIFREFGAAGTDTQAGHIAFADILYGNLEDPLVDVYGWFQQGPGANWLPTAGMNSSTEELEVCWLESASQTPAAMVALARLRPASPSASMAASPVTLDTSAETLKILTIPPKGDPALDPVLLLNPAHAISGTSVMITATVRNLGLASATGQTLYLYQERFGANTLIGTSTLTQTLAPGDVIPVVFNATALSGQQYFTALLTESNEDMGTVNNLGYGVLNALAKPDIITVASSTRFANTLDLTWQLEDNPTATGFRIVRATTIAGPYELVGETSGYNFADLGLTRAVTYYYKVQAFDANGTLSEFSAPNQGQLPAIQNTATMLAASPNPALVGQTINITATVSALAGNRPSGVRAVNQTGTVTFKDGGTTIPSCASVGMIAGQAVCAISTLALGSHAIFAVYNGDSIYNSSASSSLSQQVITVQYMPLIAK